MYTYTSQGAREMHPLGTRVQPYITHNHTVTYHVCPWARVMCFYPTESLARLASCG